MRVSVAGPASPETVWRRYATRAHWSDWAPHIRDVGPDGSQVTVGDRGRVRGPLGLRIGYEVLRCEPSAWRWAWRVGLGPVRVRMDHGVDEHPAGSTAWVDLHLPRPLALAYAPLARRALRALTR